MFQDLFASKCEDEREISAANSATANKAYQTLVQPMARVKYLVRPPYRTAASLKAQATVVKLKDMDTSVARWSSVKV